MHSDRQILTGDEGIIDSAIRSALLAREFTPRGGSSSLVGDHGETQSILQVMPGLRDHAPGFLWSETLVKAEHRAHCAADGTRRKLLKRPIRQLPDRVFTLFHRPGGRPLPREPRQADAPDPPQTLSSIAFLQMPTRDTATSRRCPRLHFCNSLRGALQPPSGRSPGTEVLADKPARCPVR